MSDAEKRSYRCIDGTVLKLIAMVSMVFDHVGDNFFPGAAWMRVIGRIAMPIFSFCVAEGFSHTRDPKRYLARMGDVRRIALTRSDKATIIRDMIPTNNNSKSMF